ncbi:MAG: hypothetical protein KC501_41370 [Myxococcales bacterium]|nr:hypothetical protein [Myxococcales bacterium]
MNAPRPIRVSTGNPISAIFGAFGRDIVDLFRNPLALMGGVFGMVLTCGLLYFSLVVVANANDDNQDEDPDLLIPFEPGVLVKLGQDIPEDQKVVVQETRAEEEVVEEETVTEEEEAPPIEEKPPEPEEKPKKIDKPPQPQEKKDKKLPTSKLPTTANTPYKNDLPTVTQQRGDPFGDPGGWGDLKKDGDPWATAVMKSLNGMKIGAFAAKAPPGDFLFQLTICKDGTIKTVSKKGGSLAADGQNQVKLALEQLDIPKPPPQVASKMTSSCAKIKYTFRWSASGVK